MTTPRGGRRRSRRRRVVIGGALAVGGIATIVGLLALEVVLAGSGARLDEYDPTLASGRVDPAANDPDADDLSAEPLRVAWLGDSTAAGVGSSGPEASVSRQVGRRLADELGRPVDIEVLAVSGARADDVLVDQLPQVAAADPDLVIISVGANDTTHLTGTGAFASQYEALLDGLPDDVVVILLGVPDIGSVTRLAQPLRALAGWQGEAYDDVVVEQARRTGSGYVDIAAETGPAFRDDPDRNLAADHYHPSDEGYALWADAIVPIAVEQVRASDPVSD